MTGAISRRRGWLSGLWVAAGLLLLAAAGCHRGAPRGVLAVRPPFSERAEVVWLRPAWREIDGGAGGIELSFEAENRLHAPLYLRLAAPRLVDGSGGVVARANSGQECRLMPGRTAGLLRSVLHRAGATTAVAGAAVDALAIPLANPGRSLYREWAWLHRPREVEAIDAELRAYDALPECASVVAATS